MSKSLRPAVDASGCSAELQAHLVDESVALTEEGTNVLTRVIIHQHLLVAQLPLMEAGNYRAGVQYMGDAFALQAVQVTSSANRTCAEVEQLPGST